jgi:hypothetical protein
VNEDRFKESLKYMVANSYEGDSYEHKKASHLWVCAFMDLVMDTDLTIEQIIHQTDHIKNYD